MGGSNIIHGRIWFLGCGLPIGPEMGSIGSMGDFCCPSIVDVSCLSLSYSFLPFSVHVNEHWLLEMMVRAGDSLLPLQWHFLLEKNYTKWNSKQIMLKCRRQLAKSSFRQFLWAFLSFDSRMALLQKSFWCSVKVSSALGISEGIFVQLLLASSSGRWTSQPAHIPQEASLTDECCYYNSWSQHNSEIM